MMNIGLSLELLELLCVIGLVVAYIFHGSKK